MVEKRKRPTVTQPWGLDCQVGAMHVAPQTHSTRCENSNTMHDEDAAPGCTRGQKDKAARYGNEVLSDGIERYVERVRQATIVVGEKR